MLKWLAAQERAAKIAWSIVLTLSGFLGYDISTKATATNDKIAKIEQKVTNTLNKVEGAVKILQLLK